MCSRTSRFVHAHCLHDLRGGRCSGHVLLVCQHQHCRVPQSVVGEHRLQLLSGLGEALSVGGVDHKDKAVVVLEVVVPKGSGLEIDQNHRCLPKSTRFSFTYTPDLVLSAHVPHRHGEVLNLDGVHVEADGGDGGDNLVELELVQDGGLPGAVQTDHANLGGDVREEAAQEVAQVVAHSVLFSRRKLKTTSAVRVVCQVDRKFEMTARTEIRVGNDFFLTET